MCTTVQSVLAVVAAAVVPLGPGVNVKLKTASGCSPTACSALPRCCSSLPHSACRSRSPQPSQTDRTAFVCQGCWLASGLRLDVCHVVNPFLSLSFLHPSCPHYCTFSFFYLIRLLGCVFFRLDIFLHKFWSMEFCHLGRQASCQRPRRCRYCSRPPRSCRHPPAPPTRQNHTWWRKTFWEK